MGQGGTASGEDKAAGYGLGAVDTVISVDDVVREAQALALEGPDPAALDALLDGAPALTIDALDAGYGQMQILHGFNLRVSPGQSLCLIGPNGAGKSTVLHSIYGFTRIFGGTIRAGGDDVTRMSSNEKLKRAGIAYILQDNSVFPDMSVEENLWMGGYLMERTARAREAAEKVFQKYPRLAERRSQPARVLSGGERRLAGDLARTCDGTQHSAGRRALDWSGTAFHRHGVRDPRRSAK